MGRTLSRTVVAGGVVYPAGTAATPELEKKITNPAHWTGDPEPTTERRGSGDAQRPEQPKRSRNRSSEASES